MTHEELRDALLFGTGKGKPLGIFYGHVPHPWLAPECRAALKAMDEREARERWTLTWDGARPIFTKRWEG